MSELRSVADSLRAEVLAELPDARIEEDFAELHHAVEQLETERLRRLAEIERRGIFSRDGHLSAAAWLVDRFKVAWGAARRHVRVARSLEQMPVVRRALEEGEISLGAADLLAVARDAEPEAFERAEHDLVQAAQIHSVGDLQRVVGFWRQLADQQRSGEGEDRLRERRRLFASPTFLGMVRVDGDLEQAGGETLLTALSAYQDAETRSGTEEDQRTPAQRRADALVEICRQWLDLAERPTVGGERPHVTVTVAAEALHAGAECGREAVGAAMDTRVLHGAHRSAAVDGASGAPTGVAELDHTGPVGIGVARLLACDCSVMRVVLSGASEPLDVGRRTKVLPPSLRRAVIVRDRSCRFPGCERPPTWCDAHHIVHWADGGPTALHNLILLCRRHHRIVHSGRFRLLLQDGRPVFRRPDGSVLQESRAPP